jgi:ectoine hydroxylase-related dioxygenase (phytanoyl-CoA dioxygenase family)
MGTEGTIERHRWNEGFAWADHHGPFRRLSETQVEQFDRDGFVVVDDVLAPAELARTIEEIDAFEAQTDERLRSLDGGREVISQAGAITFTTHLVTRSPWLRELVANPTFSDLCADLVGPDVRLYWDQAVYKKPEKPRRFPWHQDNGYTFVEPQAYLTCWVALTDATVENGCPQVVPGLHRNGTLRHRWVDPLGFECFPDHSATVAAEVPAGGAVLFSSLTPHLTGPNTTDAVRKAYIVQYAPDGAVACQGSPSAPPVARQPCDAPDRQFPVLVGGRRPAR